MSSDSAFFRLRNDLCCVGWGVKLYSLTHSKIFPVVYAVSCTLFFALVVTAATLLHLINCHYYYYYFVFLVPLVVKIPRVKS